jgi:hypothetical protein
MNCSQQKARISAEGEERSWTGKGGEESGNLAKRNRLGRRKAKADGLVNFMRAGGLKKKSSAWATGEPIILY